MLTSAKLIQKYLQSDLGNRLAEIISQIDTASQLIARIQETDFVALFYCREGGVGLIPIAYQYGHHLNIRDLEELERYWKSIGNEPLLAVTEVTDLEKSRPYRRDDADLFADNNSFSYRFVYPLHVEDRLSVVCVCYWYQKPWPISLETSTLLDLSCHIAVSAMKNAEQLMHVENYSSRLTDLLPLFEIPTTDCKLSELLDKVLELLHGLLPRATSYLFSYNTGNDQVGFQATKYGSAPSHSLLQALQGQVKRPGSRVTEEDTAKYRCRTVDLDQTDIHGNWVAFDIAPDSDYRYVVFLCTPPDELLTRNDKELLAVFAAFARTAMNNASLLHQIDQSRKLLKKSTNRLVNIEATAALADMTSGLAHEFNNIFSSILGRIQLLQLQKSERDLANGLKKIEASVKEGAETVHRIQEFATCAATKPLKPVNLSLVLEEVLSDEKSLWRQIAASKDIRVLLQPVPEEAIIQGYRADLVTMFVRLLENAVEHAPRKSDVTVVVSTSKDRVLVGVTDEGKGIPAETRVRIFYPFFTTKKQRGAGLGLTVVHGIVSQHGGKVAVESQMGHGTTFKIKFSRIEATDPISEITNKKKKLERLRVLVVDDDKEVREVLNDMLTLYGHKAEICPDAYRALEVLESREFDIVLTDLGMPGMSGLDLAGEIHKHHPKLPIAMITGWGTQLDRYEISQKGIKAVLAKPFHLKDIKALVEDLILV